MNFVAIDVETANPSYASICQIGMARFVDGALVEEWESFVDPEDEFDPVNVSIHGIDEATVRGAPTMLHLAPHLEAWLDGRVAVCHTHFDRAAMQQGCARYGLRPPACTWLNSAAVARRAWEQCAYRGYGLRNVCWMLGYEFRNHDALEDAKAAGHIVLRACEKTGLDVGGWLERVERGIGAFDCPPPASVKRTGNPDGPLYGEQVVFTGALCMPRHDAADLAARLGCEVTPGVTKHTTMLVVGDQDVRRLAGHDRSGKHRKALALALAGQPIRIVRESDFLALASVAGLDGKAVREV